MTRAEFIEKIKSEFAEHILGTDYLRANRVTVNVNPGFILDIAKFLHQKIRFRFIIASAYHTKAGFEILYHFSDDSNGNIYNIHVLLPHEKPEIQSLAQFLVAADWIEREMHELFGITFLNHPNPGKLISEGNWAEGVYPYRKDFN
ncbi:MAG TPA: NADH-quinone oxidoreductase subunit C [Salinivirga sp.]|uniref:NADH-quinone oxidoreductase subunit C n=1 Tax=Salinivirga sp. TaxID=1970192 RepID=UPI002B464352|nr:NADH-quinone oxidoreductase subunit C [Salinivirga sp.]HKK58787.1 NADH-quinone oxidoreductase subunit C [Salinivirga sp.]